MRKISLKTSGIILLFSTILTIILILCTLIIFKFNEPKFPEDILEYTIMLDGKAEFIGDKIIVSPENIVKTNEIWERLTREFISNIPGIVLFLIIVITLWSVCLIAIVKRVEKVKMLRIVNLLSDLDHCEFNRSDDAVIRELYYTLREKFKKHFLQYKRLNAYISHEQKNMIAVLQNKLEMRGEEDLLNNINELYDNIRDILTISASCEQLYSVDLALVTAECCDKYLPIYNNIRFIFDEDDNYLIMGNESWLNRAISNLIDNAIKYGLNSDIIVEIKNKKGSIILTVEDHGIGMDDNELDKVFDSEYRINRLKKDGYGIGLSVVKHVCTLCNGMYYIESKVGVGSKVYIIFEEWNNSNK